MSAQNITIPKVNKETKMSAMKNLVGRKMTKKIKFMNEDLEIVKLTVSEVMDIQEAAKKFSGEGAEAAEGDSGLELVKKVIQAGVPDASDLTDEDFGSFPMDELSKLSNEIMKLS